MREKMQGARSGFTTFFVAIRVPDTRFSTRCMRDAREPAAAALPGTQCSCRHKPNVGTTRKAWPKRPLAASSHATRRPPHGSCRIHAAPTTIFSSNVDLPPLSQTLRQGPVHLCDVTGTREGGGKCSEAGWMVCAVCRINPAIFSMAGPGAVKDGGLAAGLQKKSHDDTSRIMTSRWTAQTNWSRAGPLLEACPLVPTPPFSWPSVRLRLRRLTTGTELLMTYRHSVLRL